ncbi:MAG: hypothetical protein AB7S97_01520 [Thermoplasmata archaeon]
MSSNGPKKGVSPAAKMAAVAIIVILLIAVPLGYFTLTGDDDDDDDDDGDDDDTIVISVSVSGKAGESQTVNYTTLEGMDFIEAVSSYQNTFGNWRGLGTYGGVELRDLADLVGGMGPGDVMTITATDGFRSNLTYYQVYADAEYLETQGRIILAYEYNSTIMDEEDRPMIAVLASDEAFSNEDFNATCSRDPEFLSSTSAGSLWVKTVSTIEVRELYDEWSVNLTDLDNATTELTRTDFVRLAYFNSAEWTDGDGGVWSGASLSSTLGMIDDDDPETFNQTLADTEYQVQVMASDEYNKTFVAKYLVENGTLLANMYNGTALGEEDAPLRIVGDNMTGGQMVSMIASITMLPPLEPDTPEEVVLTVVGTTTIDFTLSELQALTTYTSMGGFIKSTGTVIGPDEYTGVQVKDLIAMVYSGGEYSVEVVATDDYTITYNYSQVEDNLFEHFDSAGTSLGYDTFTMVVAYAQDGLPLVDMVLRIAIIDDSEPITNSELWAKMVRTIKVVPFIEEWTLELNGTSYMEMDRQGFEAIASCDYHQVSWSFENDTGTHTYTGVALWVLISAVDGADGPEDEFSFNDLQAFAGYGVRVTASDGYNRTFTSTQVARNDSIIVANRLDGEPLSEDEWPLRVVGDWLPGYMKVGQVVNISMEDLQPVPDWELTMIGTRTISMSAESLVSMYYSGLHGPWFNYSDSDGMHAAFYTFTNDTDVEHTYAGIPLWMLVAIVDGEDLDHYEFNESLATSEYNVLVSSGDYDVPLPISTIAYNNSIILAFMYDGELLADDEYPLRLVGEYLSKSQSVKAVDTIELVDLPA